MPTIVGAILEVAKLKATTGGVEIVAGGLAVTAGTITATTGMYTSTIEAAAFVGPGTEATTGVLRIANANVIAWRNAANSDNMFLYVNAGNELRYETSGGIASGISVGAIVATAVTSSNFVEVGGASHLRFSARSRVLSPADNIIMLSNASEADFGRLQFGGTTASFPALKRNSIGIECRLADDSGFAPFGGSFLAVADGIAAPGAIAGSARIYVDTADGDLKVIFADGVIKTLATDT